MWCNVYRIGIIDPIDAKCLDDVLSIRLMKDTNQVTEFYTSLLEHELAKDKSTSTITIVRDQFRQDLPDEEFEVSTAEIGKSFKLSNGIWRTSKVIAIINDMIFMTHNSVYALHNKQKFRSITLGKLFD
jgi:hypothetical protein